MKKCVYVLPLLFSLLLWSGCSEDAKEGGGQEDQEVVENKVGDIEESLPKEEITITSPEKESEIAFEDIMYRIYKKKTSSPPNEYGEYQYDRWITKKVRDSEEEKILDIPRDIPRDRMWEVRFSGISPSGNIAYIETSASLPGRLYGLQTESGELLWEGGGIRAGASVFWSPDRKQAAFISDGFFDGFPSIGVTEYGNVRKVNWIFEPGNLALARDGNDDHYFYWKDNSTFIISIPYDDIIYSDSPEQLEAEGLHLGINEFTVR